MPVQQGVPWQAGTTASYLLSLLRQCMELPRLWTATESLFGASPILGQTLYNRRITQSKYCAQLSRLRPFVARGHILQPHESLTVYQNIFTLLIQIRRAKSMLEGLRIVKVEVGVTAKRLYYGLRHGLLWFTTYCRRI